MVVAKTRHFLRGCRAYCTRWRKVTKVTNPISDFTFLSTAKSGKSRIQNPFLDSPKGTHPYLDESPRLDQTFSPPQRLPLGIPIKISIIEKIESARGSFHPSYRAPRALFLSPQPPHKNKSTLRRREHQEVVVIVIARGKK